MDARDFSIKVQAEVARSTVRGLKHPPYDADQVLLLATAYLNLLYTTAAKPERKFGELSALDQRLE